MNGHTADEISHLLARIDWKEDRIRELTSENERSGVMVNALVDIVDQMCIELKKDNTLPARRKRAKYYHEQMAGIRHERI